MIGLIILTIFVLTIIFYFIRISNKKKRSFDIHHTKVVLKDHEYMSTQIMMLQPTFESKLASRFSKIFIKILNTDFFHRPQGTIVSWKYQDSLDWFDEKNHFKYRKLTRKTNTSKSLIANPVGWTQRYVSLITPRKLTSKSESSTHLFERGHLAPYWITQNESDRDNLILLTQYTNKGFEKTDATDEASLYFGAINPESMLAIESEIKHFVIGKGCKDRLKDATFQVMINPIYDESDYAPFEIQYTIQLLGLHRNLLSFEFLGKTISSGHCLQIKIPVQLSDGTQVVVIKKEN